MRHHRTTNQFVHAVLLFCAYAITMRLLFHFVPSDLPAIRAERLSVCVCVSVSSKQHTKNKSTMTVKTMPGDDDDND